MEGYSIHFTKLASLILKHDRKRKESRDGRRERGKVEGKKNRRENRRKFTPT